MPDPNLADLAATCPSSQPDAQPSRPEPSKNQRAPGVFARAPRTVPAWIGPYRAGDAPPHIDQLKALETPMPRPLPRRRNKNKPSGLVKRVSFDGHVEWDSGKRRKIRDPNSRLRRLVWATNSERGRRWDHLRSDEPVILPDALDARARSPWGELVHSCEWGHLPERESHVVAPDLLDQMYPNFDRPVQLSQAHDARRGPLRLRLWSAVVTNPFVPLLFRMTVLVASTVSLALASKTLHRLESEPGQGGSADSKNSLKSQTIMAVAVDSVAIPYIGYMLFDEYAGQPLGLRPTEQKVSLVLMDLFFIIFKSSTTTLAFESLAQKHYIELEPDDTNARNMLRALARATAAFQLISLLSWLVNFIINIFRLVQRLGGAQVSARQRGWRTHAASKVKHKTRPRGFGRGTSSAEVRAMVQAKERWLP